MPMLAVMLITSPPTAIRTPAIASWSSALSVRAWARETLVSMTTNSSPPSRAIVSVARIRLLSAVATALSSSSPAPVTVGVVHRLEPIEVDHQQGGVVPVAPATADLASELLLEPAPVPEVGEGVAVGQALERVRKALALRDVLVDGRFLRVNSAGGAEERLLPLGADVFGSLAIADRHWDRFAGEP